MMRVRAKRRHENAYGDSYIKHPSKQYEHPSPQTLIADGVVEEVKPGKAPEPDTIDD